MINGLKLLFFVLFFFFAFHLNAKQIFDNSARTLTPVSRADIWSPFSNTATLGSIENPQASIFYQDRFGIKELSSKSAQVAYPNQLIDVGLSLSSFGFSAYNENILGLGFARKFSEKLILSTQFNYYSLFFSKSEIQNKAKLLVQVGILSKPMPGLSLGFHVFNPFQSNININHFTKTLPSIFSVGGSYAFSEKIQLGIQLDKEIQSPIIFSSEFEYLIVDAFLIKLGVIASEEIMPSMGFGVNLYSFQLDVNAEFHATLGVFSNVCLTYKFR